jgi:uncharacterized protein (DUF2336 family)
LRRRCRVIRKATAKKDVAKIESATLLDELQRTLAHDSVARRVQTLRRVTDMFLGRCVDYSDEQIALFDDVFICLLDQVETSALSILARKLAPIPNAPPVTMRTLAFNPSIAVAEAPLALSEQVDDETLTKTARKRDQDHLLAISQRRTINESVTDELVRRGNTQVVTSVVDNPGAVFSEFGFETLIKRAEKRDGLTTRVALRNDIPRHYLLKLLAKASDIVLSTLKAKLPDRFAEIEAGLDEIRRQARAATKTLTPSATIAHALVRSLYDDGRIDDQQVLAFARVGKFDETTASLACLAQVSVDLAETIMIDQGLEGIFILAKVAKLSWATVEEIIALRHRISHKKPARDESQREAYERLQSSTAQQVLRFYRMEQATHRA